jgi:DNA-binding LytR/AlgR family response regulator
LQRERLVAALVGHVLGTALFAAAHYFLMVGFRYVVFLFSEQTYIFSDYWFRNLVIEYQKDIKIYLATVGIIAAYRHIRAARGAAPAATVMTDRMVVQTGKGETIIRRDDIEYLEAARNYVTVSTGERDFLVRNTLAKLEEQLAPGQIVRTHRSYLVNIDKIEEIRTTDTGGYEIRLASGKTVPLSRGYRDSFRSLFAVD